MNKSKKLLAIGAIAALGLAACGSDDETPAEAPTTDTPVETDAAPAETDAAPAETDAPAEPAEGDFNGATTWSAAPWELA